MRGISLILSAVLMFAAYAADAATTRAIRSGTTAVERIASPSAGYTYNYMYPYLNNEMRTALNPGVTTSQSANPINTVVRTEQLSAPRRVVARSTTGAAPAAAARAATNTAIRANTTATAPAAAQNTNPNRRVVARAATNSTGARDTRGDYSYLERARENAAANMPTSTKVAVSSARCLADYIDCMDGYCKRENMAYNRCYCSSKLAQIDSQYKNQIDDLVTKLITVRNKGNWTRAEMDEYWMSVIGQYTGENSWANLESALDINWADLESRVRGQQAFTTGNDYCVRNLSNCYAMAGNMRDAYVSQINRDCQVYENSLQLLKNALESTIRTYE